VTWERLHLRTAHKLTAAESPPLAHRVPALKLARHVLAEGLGGRAAHDYAGRGQALLHGVLLEALIDGRVELGDDLARNFAFVSGNGTVGARALGVAPTLRDDRADRQIIAGRPSASIRPLKAM
jgi:hypothetical protein